jgi:hypothetical protein
MINMLMILLSTKLFKEYFDFDIKKKISQLDEFSYILMPHRVWISSYRVCDVDEP